MKFHCSLCGAKYESKELRPPCTQGCRYPYEKPTRFGDYCTSVADEEPVKKKGYVVSDQVEPDEQVESSGEIKIVTNPTVTPGVTATQTAKIDISISDPTELVDIMSEKPARRKPGRKPLDKGLN